MNCEILDILYLRANGEIPCNCATGERVNLGWMDDTPDWSIEEVLRNARYAAIRQAFAENRLPWGEICERCVFLQRGEPVRDHLAKKRIARFHLEPSLACALRCPGCSRVRQAGERKGPFFLRLDLFRRLLGQLRDGGYTIDLFFLCGQGEPLSHPQTAQLVDLVREHFPVTPLAINTNGNYDYARVLQGRHVDQLIVSVDGLHQASYEKYRIRGRVAPALQFMRDAKDPAQAKVPHVEWKYILFRYNDSDDEIVAAQRRAEELGIDSLRFVLTHTPERSERYTAANIADLPLVSPLAYPESTPQNDSRVRRVLVPRPSPSLAAPGWSGSLDQCDLIAGQILLSGWIRPPAGAAVEAVEIEIDGAPLGRAVAGVSRPDVSRALGLPETGSKLGFRLLRRLEREPTAEFRLTIGVGAAGGARHVFELCCAPDEAVALFNPDNNY